VIAPGWGVGVDEAHPIHGGRNRISLTSAAQAVDFTQLIDLLSRKHRNDPEGGRFDNDDLVLDDEHPMPAEARNDAHDLLRDADEPHVPWDHRPHAYVEIDAIHPRDVASRRDDVVNARSLVCTDVHVDVTPAPGIGPAVDFTSGTVGFGPGATLTDRARAVTIPIEALGAPLSGRFGAVHAVLPLAGRGRPAALRTLRAACVRSPIARC